MLNQHIFCSMADTISSRRFFLWTHATFSTCKKHWFAGSRIRNIILNCFMQLLIREIKMPSDQANCLHIPAITPRVSMSHPLVSLILPVCHLIELPFYDSILTTSEVFSKSPKGTVTWSESRWSQPTCLNCRPCCEWYETFKTPAHSGIQPICPLRNVVHFDCYCFCSLDSFTACFIFVHPKSHPNERLFPVVVEPDFQKKDVEPVLLDPDERLAVQTVLERRLRNHFCIPALFVFPV